MPCRIPERKRESIKVKLALNQHVKTIAKDNNVSQRAVYHYRQNMRLYGALRPPKKPGQGRPPKITQEMQDVRGVYANLIVAETLTNSHSSITCPDALLCTSMSMYTTCGIPSTSMLVSSLCNVCWHASNG